MIFYLLIDLVANKIYHEIESFDSASGKIVAWVNVPLLSSSIDTVLYMYYGNPSCVNQENVEEVWDTNFKMVHHMNEFSGDIIDSTDNNVNSISIGGSPAYMQLGKIGNCIIFDSGSMDYFNMGNTVDMGTSDYSLECWAKTTQQNVRGGVISKRRWSGQDGLYDGYRLWFDRVDDEYGLPTATINDVDTKTDGRVESDRAYNDGSWHYIAASFDRDSATGGKIFIDGVQSGDSVNLLSYTSSISNPRNLVIGADSQPTLYFDGSIDEIRISSVDRSEAWIKTSFNSMNDPSSFMKCAKPVSKKYDKYLSNLDFYDDSPLCFQILMILYQLFL